MPLSLSLAASADGGLDRPVQGLSGYLDAAHAPATRRAYARDWAAWETWAAEHNATACPAEPLAVATFLSDCADAGLAVATIARRAAAIAHVHTGRGLDAPTRQDGVRRTMAGIRRTAARAGRRPRQATTLDVETIRAVVRELPEDLAGTRDRAVILVGYALGLRASDLVGLDVGDIAAGERGGLDVTIRWSKTDQDGAGATLALAAGSRAETCPVTALRVWIRESGIERGPLFRSVRAGATRTVGGGRLATSSITRLLQRAVGRVEGAPRVSSHTLRRSFATSAFRAGVPERELARTGRWASVPVMRSYDGSSRWGAPASGRLGL